MYPKKKSETDPYCPTVLAMPPDDTPFIIESSDELPAGRRRKWGMRLRS
jgi:hypothetical protein